MSNGLVVSPAAVRHLGVLLALDICVAVALAPNATRETGLRSRPLDDASQIRRGSLVRRQSRGERDDRHLLHPAYDLMKDDLIPGLGSDADHEASLVEVGAAGGLPGGKLYTIQVLGKYCTDNEEASIKCDSSTIGTWESFNIFHFSRRPDLHVIKGGHSGKWCRDHGNHIACNREDYTESECFKLLTMGSFKAMRGPERDMWCSVKQGVLQCNEPDLSKGEAQHFVLTPLPGAGEIQSLHKVFSWSDKPAKSAAGAKQKHKGGHPKGKKTV